MAKTRFASADGDSIDIRTGRTFLFGDLPFNEDGDHTPIPFLNEWGYADPTAYQAITNVYLEDVRRRREELLRARRDRLDEIVAEHRDEIAQMFEKKGRWLYGIRLLDRKCGRDICVTRGVLPEDCQRKEATTVQARDFAAKMMGLPQFMRWFMDEEFYPKEIDILVRKTQTLILYTQNEERGNGWIFDLRQSEASE